MTPPKINDNYRCHCGKLLHYSDINTQRRIEEIVERFGPYIDVVVDGGRTYRVQRHYIALHGINGKSLGRLGFQEVKNV